MKNLFFLVVGMMLGIGLCDSIPQEVATLAVFSIGVVFLTIAMIVKIARSIRAHIKRKKEMSRKWAEAEMALFGRVINIEDIRAWRNEVKPREVDIPSFMKDVSDKERKYEMAMQRMEQRRKNAPPLKAKKNKPVKQKKQVVSLKERAGGIRRAS